MLNISDFKPVLPGTNILVLRDFITKFAMMKDEETLAEYGLENRAHLKESMTHVLQSLHDFLSSDWWQNSSYDMVLSTDHEDLSDDGMHITLQLQDDPFVGLLFSLNEPEQNPRVQIFFSMPDKYGPLKLVRNYEDIDTFIEEPVSLQIKEYLTADKPMLNMWLYDQIMKVYVRTSIRKIGDWPHLGAVLDIGSIEVFPQHQGQGHCYQFLRECEKWVPAPIPQKVFGIFVENVLSPRLCDILERAGYEKIEDGPCYFKTFGTPEKPMSMRDLISMRRG